MAVAARRAGDETRAVWIICHSPAQAGLRPLNKKIRGYFSEKVQYETQRKISFLIIPHIW
jgi:hypothetical protein